MSPELQSYHFKSVSCKGFYFVFKVPSPNLFNVPFQSRRMYRLAEIVLNHRVTSIEPSRQTN